MVALCTAESYNFKALREVLQARYRCSPLKCDDVLHCKLDVGEVFFFENGSFVLWPNISEGNMDVHLKSISSLVKEYETVSISNPEVEELEYQELPNLSNAKIEGECLLVPESGIDESAKVMTRLAFSNGLADSVKLATLENYLQEHIEKVKHIPWMLQRGGKLIMTRSEVLKLIGELLHFRAVLNLQSELIDTPELYWSEPVLESLYLKTSRLLETRTRIAILNKKLDYANEMTQVLRSHLSEQHGLKLEWGIIALIAVEVFFELAHYIK